MENAKKELLEKLQGKADVLCAWIGYERTYEYDVDDKETYEKMFKLKTNHTKEDFNSFLELLNFDYSDGYGCQNLFGYVWLKDGTWFERGEYDGSEWWNYNKIDDVPNDLKS